MQKLTAEQLRIESGKTPDTSPSRYSLLAKALFLAMDLLYGRRRSWSKFKVLEVIARVPYQAWEHVPYIAITHVYERQDFARRIFERVRACREQQDNEQWHLLILEEWTDRQRSLEGFLRYRFIPQVIAFFYYQIAWLLYVIKPAWSYRLNADFEAYAEHEYMRFVREHPELEREPFVSTFKQDYGNFVALADVLRQIGYDERVHKEDSLAKMAMPRFE